MSFSIRPATQEDYAGLNALLEEIDAYHRKALPHVFREPDGAARTRDFITGALADENAVIFLAEIHDQVVGLLYAYVRSIPDIPIRIPCRAGEIDMIKDVENRSLSAWDRGLISNANQSFQARTLFCRT